MDNEVSYRRAHRRILRIASIGLPMLFAIQLIPYGREHSNPPVTQEPAWDSPQTRAMVKASCFDCHSNQVHWYWYTNIAPISWLAQRDVNDGRASINFSEWNLPHDSGAGDVIDAIKGGGMPPIYYWIAHWNAKLSAAEKQQLIAGLQKTFQTSPPLGGGG